MFMFLLHVRSAQAENDRQAGAQKIRMQWKLFNGIFAA